MVQEVYKICGCGSGKKFKWCCKNKPVDNRSLYEKISSGEIPFSARVYSTNGESSSIKIENASVTIGGLKKMVINQPVVLSTNGICGEETASAAVSISVPVNGNSIGNIYTSGNASVESQSGIALPNISIFNGKKRLKKEGINGLHVTVYIGLQRNTGRNFLCILFGRSGQKEEINSEGVKNRPHIEVYPDGNGKFIRIKSHCCEISSECTYEPVTGETKILSLIIVSKELRESVELKFNHSKDEIILESVEFERKT